MYLNIYNKNKANKKTPTEQKQTQENSISTKKYMPLSE